MEDSRWWWFWKRKEGGEVALNVWITGLQELVDTQQQGQTKAETEEEGSSSYSREEIKIMVIMLMKMMNEERILRRDNGDGNVSQQE